MADLMHELEDGGEAQRLAAMEVNEALGYTILGPPVTSWLLEVAAARG